MNELCYILIISIFNFLIFMHFTNQTTLKLVSVIFYQIFIFSQNDSPLKTIFLFQLKSSFCSQDIQIFVIFFFPFHTFQIQKDKWKWNSL